jgi:hypothetical protein
MPLDNLGLPKLTPDAILATIDLVNQLDATLGSDMVNLSPEERQKYGSINEQNKLLVNKVKEYQGNQPKLASPDVNWDKFKEDYQAREAIEGIVLRLKEIIKGLENTKIMHDYDNYHDSLLDYAYTEYKTSTKQAGYETKYSELRQFFNKSPRSTKNTTDTDTAE